MANAKTGGDALVDEMMARYQYAYTACYDHFVRMQRIQNVYDNQVSSLNWPTISQISIPLTFTAVDEQLPFAMKYLFPDRRFIELIPMQAGMDAARVRTLEEALLFTVRVEMQLEMAMLPSVRDCYKFAVGYGLIDVLEITPPSVSMLTTYAEGAEPSETPMMGVGQPKVVPVYRYMSPAQVVPMPDGANVEGPNKASGHFVVDLMYEDRFRSLYKRGNGTMKGSPDDIVKQARAFGFDCRMILPDVIKKLSGIDLARTNNGDTKMPVVVPVVRCYFDNEHTWIANGKTVIYHKKDTFQTLRSDLVKFSGNPDGSRWFPLGITEASERLSVGANIWYSGLVDLAMYHMNPTRLINTRLTDPSRMARGPNADIEINGPPDQAVRYMELPQFPGQLFTMGDVLTGFHGAVNATPSNMRNLTPGLVRGGVNALEMLMGSTTGRQMLAAVILKSGGLHPAIEKVLIKKQLLADRDGEKFVDVSYDENTKQRRFDEKTVTLEDLRNVFRVWLNLPVGKMNSQVDAMQRAAYFDRAMRAPQLFDLRSLYEELSDDESLVRRTMLPANVVEQRQQQMAAAQMKAIERGSVQAGGQPGGTAPEEAGAEGAVPVEAGQA
jgi:hypothetical protein